MSQPKTNPKYTEQHILNQSFDESFEMLTTSGLEYDGSVLRRAISKLLATRIDTSGGTTIYIGKAPIGSATSSAVWSIKKLDTSSGVVITWADSGNFTQIWDNRSGLTYA